MNKNKKYKATASVLGDRCVIKVQSYSVLQRFFKTVSAFTLIFLMLLGASIEGVGQVSIYSENFGTGTSTPGGWTLGGWSINTSQSSSTPTFSGGSNASSSNNNNARTITFANNISTVGYSNISILWAARRAHTNTVVCQWSINGTTWNNLTFTDVSNSSSWEWVNGGTRITLPSGAENATNLRLRWTYDSDGFAGRYRIDDFSVEGCYKSVISTNPSSSSVCVGSNANLSTEATNYPIYQWQSSSDGSTWSYVSSPFNSNPFFFESDFSSIPANTNVYGSASVTGDNLQLTPVTGSQLGGFVIQSTPGTNFNAFNVNFDYRIYDGTGADGFSLSYGSNIANNAGTGEEGESTGIIIKFDSYDNSAGTTNSQIRVNYNGSQIWANSVGSFNLRNANYRKINIYVDHSGSLSLSIGGTTVISSLAIPGYTSTDKSNWKFKFSGRTGGLNDTHRIDNLKIQYGDDPTLSVSPASTTYYRAIVNPGPCSTVSNVATVTVNTASTAPTSITGTTTICSGTPVTLTVSGGSLGTGASWNWYSGSCGGTFVGTGNSIIVNPSTTTTYFVRAEGTCNTTTCASGTITVNPAPTLTSISASPTSACTGSDVTITVNGLISGLNAISYDYTIDGSTTSSSVNLTPSGGVASTSLNNLPAGNYQVKINSITVNGCSTNFSTNNTANWTINPEATPTFTQLGPYCAGNTSDALPGTSNNGITGTWNPSSINTATSGTIIYTFTPTAGQCATTATMSVPVNSLPAVFNVTGGGTYCGSALAIGLSDSETGINYQLFRDGSTLVSTVAGTGSPISFVPQSDIGTYTVVANNSVTGCAINMSGSAIISTDSEAPVARCKTNISVNTNAGGQAIITPAMVDNGSTDNCGIMSMIVSPETLSCAGSGSTATTYSKDIVSSDGYTVHISVTDMWVEPSTNNCAVGGYNYTIGYNYSISFSGSGIPSALDNFDIVIGCDHTMYGELPETQGTGTNFTNSQYRSDSDCATVTPDDIHCSVVNVRIQGPGISYQTVTLDPISGSGSNTVTLTVTDAAGNSNSCTTNVTLIDAVSPAVTCPANVNVSADANSCSATGVSLETPVTIDNCGVASITNNAPASFPVGNTTVTWTVTDNAGNTNTCAQTVTVDPNPVDIEVVDLGNSCQSGETGSQTSVAWTVNKLSGVGSWTYYYEIKNGSTVVANATRTVTGSTDSVNFTVNNITNTNLNYTITISGVSDDCGTTETNTANNSDTVTLFGVPDTGDIHTN